MPRNSGTLYVVATPIGHLGDITLRAIETLRSCDVVAAEDTRRTRALLAHLGITGKSLMSLHAHSSAKDVEHATADLVAGRSIALVTDAGTPAVSDPGAALVEAAIALAIPVVAVPGASAVLAALVASGLAGDGRFRFAGFLPRDGAGRRDAILMVCSTPETVIVFEAPNRTAATLRDLADATPGRAACVARELTKVHEELARGSLADLAADTREWRGEVVLVLGPHSPESRAEVTDDALDARIDEGLRSGVHAKSLAERLAAWSGRTKRDIYERVLARKGR
jgi:16S rRNA (cytidine1402-2'-O)-methyltransferase